MNLTRSGFKYYLKKTLRFFYSWLPHLTILIFQNKPFEKDLQQPHDRDEVYVVISGTGKFINGDTKTFFNPGDFLFVPAGVEHTFIDFTNDFSTWVIFYGPAGGEKIA